MTTPTRTTPADPLAVLLTLGVLGERSDAHLLELYRSRSVGSGEAFRVLVERHGPMVLAVCRGLVPDRGEADDAFQAVFLVLIRRADAIRKADSLGPWLHGVALRVARRASRRSARRTARVRPVDPAALSRNVARDPAPDATALIHAEIDRLPERYRSPIILCGLEGLSYEQAARALDVSEPALRGRLHRGRKRLEARLARQGVAAPGSLALAGPPARLVETVLAQAADGPLSSLPVSVSSLAKGAILAMSLSSWKPLAFASLATLGVVGSVVLAQQTGPVEPEKAQRQTAPAPLAPVPLTEAPAKPPSPRRLPPTREELEIMTKAIRVALAQPHDFDFPNGIEIEELLRLIRKVTSKPGEPGVPVYVNPIGLSVTERSMSTNVAFVSKGRPIAEALRDALAMINLGFVVKDGFVMVDSRAAAADLKLDVVEEKLERLTKLIEERLPTPPSSLLPAPLPEN